MPTSTYDTYCVTETNASGTITELCDSPLLTHLGFMLDIILVLFIASLCAWFLYKKK